MAMNKQRALKSAALVVERAVELGVGSARREGRGEGGQGQHIVTRADQFQVGPMEWKADNCK